MIKSILVAVDRSAHARALEHSISWPSSTKPE